MSDYLEFAVIRSRCRALSKKSWSNYLRSTESAIFRNVKTFWSFINNIQHKNSSPSCIRVNNNIVEDDLAIADVFADYFELYARDSSARVGTVVSLSRIIYRLSI